MTKTYSTVTSCEIKISEHKPEVVYNKSIINTFSHSPNQ